MNNKIMDSKRAKILVVDDEPEVVETLKHFLSVKGFDAVGALSGEEALSVLENEHQDLILLDIMMPGLHGDEVAKIIQERHPGVKIIIVTGNIQQGEKLETEGSLDGVFIKPLKIQELYSKLTDVLNTDEKVAIQAAKGLKARVLLIKAKILFIEPSRELCDTIRMHFKNLAHKGEYYEMESAADAADAAIKLTAFNPDIVVGNGDFITHPDNDIACLLSENNIFSKEVIRYNVNAFENIDKEELDRAIRAVQMCCFKNGLIETKWVEI